MTLRQEVGLQVLRTARRHAANTRLAELPFTNSLYGAVARWSCGSRTAVRFRGLDLEAPRPDPDMFPALVGGYYERVELDLFELLAADCRTVVDVGGNIGIHTCVAARALPPGGRVVVYEPVPENAHHLRRNVERNCPGADVLLQECAVGEAVGRAEIHLGSGIGGHSMAAGNVGTARETHPVPVVTLDTHLAELGAGEPDLIKIDVEGYDAHVLRGARRTLRSVRPTVFVELVPEQLARCGEPPSALIEELSAAYPTVFLIDERRGTARPRTPEELRRTAARRVNLNLVAVARPEHLQLICTDIH